MPAPPNPFMPPDASGPDGQGSLELVDVPKKPRGAAPVDEAPIIDTAPVVPPPRAAVAYKNPDSAGRTVLVLVLAAAGLGVVFVGFKLLRGKSSDAPAPAANVSSKPAPSKPVVWQALDKGDNVLVTIEVTPKAVRSARLLLDGEPLTSNPIALPRGSQHRVAATADGYEPDVVELLADAPKAVTLTLRKQRQ